MAIVKLTVLKAAVDVGMLPLQHAKSVGTDDVLDHDHALTFWLSPSLVCYHVYDDGVKALQYLKTDLRLTNDLKYHKLRCSTLCSTDSCTLPI